MMVFVRPYLVAWAFCLLMLIGMVVESRAQQGGNAPTILSFQGTLLRKDSTLFVDGTYNLTAELFDADTGGRRLYTTTIPVVVVKGIYNMIIGEVDPLDGVDFTKQLWLEIKAPDALPAGKRTELMRHSSKIYRSR